MDNNDNVLLARRRVRLGRQWAWSAYSRLYWHSVIRLVHTLMISGDVANPNLHVGFRPELNLETVETYWEFSVDDPLSFVRRIQPCIAAQGFDPQARSFGFPRGFVVEGGAGNTLSLKVRVRPGVYLVVYAKTTRRVRFEIRHKLKEDAQALGGSHTSEGNLDVYLQWLERLAGDASEHLNRVLGELDRYLSPPPVGHPLWLLVSRVHHVARDEGEAELILSLLVNRATIQLGPNDPLREPVKALERQGILRRPLTNRQVYVPSDGYRRSIEQLRELGERS
ncbi:hypothetical protein [Thalassobaculum sp.]|uniref:hypothetical protein n=1 Tax=Thalassobaculum sp. TaxID=2022740 RepID=UPI0032EAB49B